MTMTGYRSSLPSPEGWWKLDEGRGDTAGDSSGHGHDLRLEGGAGWDADSSVTPARVSLSLDGKGQYAQAVGRVVDTVKPYTVTAWVWLDPAGHGSKLYATAVSQGGQP
jgi:alpha-N-arabinofuranosidase